MASATALRSASVTHMINVVDIGGYARLVILAGSRRHQEGPDPQMPGPARRPHRGSPLIRRFRVFEAL